MCSDDDCDDCMQVMFMKWEAGECAYEYDMEEDEHEYSWILTCVDGDSVEYVGIRDCVFFYVGL